jgi:hypothetical protein
MSDEIEPQDSPVDPNPKDPTGYPFPPGPTPQPADEPVTVKVPVPEGDAAEPEPVNLLDPAQIAKEIEHGKDRVSLIVGQRDWGWPRGCPDSCDSGTFIGDAAQEASE